MQQRPSPKDKPVSLFVTCLIDMLFPQVGLSTVRILEHLGLSVTFPESQTCCGQPAFNSGCHKDARLVARQFLAVFRDAEVIVTPSGSCAAMIRHEYPRLFASDAGLAAEAAAIAGKTWELSEFLVDGLQQTDLGGELPSPASFAFHDACHGLRILGLGSQCRSLVASIKNASLRDLSDHDVCCGFGGLFSTKMPDISGAMLAGKTQSIKNCEADNILIGDASCMMHINGGLAKQESAVRVRHYADVLAESLGHAG